jgi:C-terminal processing protease CtpA/Prc
MPTVHLDQEGNMKKMLTASAATVLALAVTVPAFAGGAHCSGADKASATTADAKASCASKATTAAWTGAWLQRSASGKVTVADVAKGSPAAKSGLKAGDVVLAVNGYDLSDSEDRAMCASKAECNIGSAVTYTVQRGRSTKAVKFKLERMPANATERLASRQASFDRALATVVLPTVN